MIILFPGDPGFAEMKGEVIARVVSEKLYVEVSSTSFDDCIAEVLRKKLGKGSADIAEE